ncbi:hypothetical protein AAFF_G00210400 [Aldrovandia affinis]|uniref:Cytochrome c oxidase assembly factor 5 n=1 Tax=Aldrovandia affinis TaxID=143900 RepID=A0AAD7SWA6_9TELE|nr:hypothetical protein AAFF_G00210400 [Aldrovandia affinis]
MPKYYEEKEEDNRACSGIREDFKSCLLQHDCVVKEGKRPSECLKEGHCKGLQVSFFECKRSMKNNAPLDNKASIAGHNSFEGTPPESEGSGLYLAVSRKFCCGEFHRMQANWLVDWTKQH